MDYEKLLTGLTVRQFDELAENWYARLNKLKERQFNSPNEKTQRLIIEMFVRMITLSEMYTRVHTPQPPKDYAQGGMVSREAGPEMVISSKGNRFKL